jgi:hypothetical protein
MRGKNCSFIFAEFSICFLRLNLWSSVFLLLVNLSFSFTKPEIIDAAKIRLNPGSGNMPVMITSFSSW